ncbi:hypothetical protein BDZ89DRAFT_1121642 [Hymenopellis radicata]|nr:hypothetical protein BDZ89DRAFT_1121642 [Hymenopellis radicata]
MLSNVVAVSSQGLHIEIVTKVARLQGQTQMCQSRDKESIPVELPPLLRGLTRLESVSNWCRRADEHQNAPRTVFEGAAAGTKPSRTRKAKTEKTEVGQAPEQVLGPTSTSTRRAVMQYPSGCAAVSAALKCPQNDRFTSSHFTRVWAITRQQELHRARAYVANSIGSDRNFVINIQLGVPCSIGVHLPMEYVVDSWVWCSSKVAASLLRLGSNGAEALKCEFVFRGLDEFAGPMQMSRNLGDNENEGGKGGSTWKARAREVCLSAAALNTRGLCRVYKLSAAPENCSRPLRLRCACLVGPPFTQFSFKRSSSSMATRRAIERLTSLLYPQQAGPCLGREEELLQCRVSLYDLVLIRAQDNVREARNRDPAVQALLDMAQCTVDYASASGEGPSQSVPGALPLSSSASVGARPLAAPSPKKSRKRTQDDADLGSAPARSKCASKGGSASVKGAGKKRLRKAKAAVRCTPTAAPPTTGPPAFKRQRREGDLTELPSVAYAHIGDSSQVVDAVSFRSSGECRGQRRKALYKDGKNRAGAETYAGASLKAENLPMSSTGWMGTLYDSAAASALRQAHQAGAAIHQYLTGLFMVPYKGLATRIVDASGRLIIFRSQIGKDMVKIMPDFIKQAEEFVKECTPMPNASRQGNKRGQHWFCIAGVDRNLKDEPSYSEWHSIPKNKAAVEKAFLPGTPFSRVGGMANDVCATNFPGIAARYRKCADTIGRKYSLRPMFGLFWNWCLNAALPSQGIKRVYCDPHVDWKNIALGVCVFNHQEKAWLVIWEANVCLELPPGVFLLYSSSLFFHFNVDVDAIKIVTTKNGEKPTPENSKPLDQQPLERPENVSEEDWAAGNGRGSVVWFNQASMFQTAETGYDTLTLAREAGHTGNCDVQTFLYGEHAVYPV